MAPAHPLRDPALILEIERAASEHLGRPWISQGFTDLAGRASHPCAILHGQPFSVFAKLGQAARDQFAAELAGLRLLTQAVDSGNLTTDLAREVTRIAGRLLALAGPEPEPSLLHGDAQQNNFVSTTQGAVAIDASPYFGHPEIDLAQVGFFHPVPAGLFEAYQEIALIDPGFTDRRDLWRLPTHLAVVAAAGHEPAGQQHVARLADAIRRYR
jgi:fructosamine-3-kinase